MNKAVRTFTILKNNSDVERIKINLEKTDDGKYRWVYEDDDLPEFGTVKEACEWAKMAYNNIYWRMRSNW